MSKNLLPYKSAKVADLIPYARNARTHSEAQVKKIMASIAEFGFINPVIADGKNGIIAGHGRVMAAERLGMEDVPTVEAAHLTEAQKRAYILADNRLALDAGWDDEILRVELIELQDAGFDLSDTGFDLAEIDALLAEKTEGKTDPDDVPEPPADPVTVEGDVWLLGRHRIICGDSTNAEVVNRLLGDVRPHLMVTDPPYGVNYDAGWRSSLDCIDRATGLVNNDDRADWGEAYALFPGYVAYVWHAGLHSDVVAEGLAKCGLKLRAQIIWVKPHFSIGRGDYHVQHEPCWYAVKGKGEWQGSRKESTVWQIANGTFQGGKPSKENAKTGHGTQKPVECMKRPIENNSSPGQVVYEPFSGSGTTIIAGEMTGRHIYAVELNPAYVDVAVRRWQDFTGEAAFLEGDGRSFDEVAAERIAA